MSNLFQLGTRVLTRGDGFTGTVIGVRVTQHGNPSLWCSAEVAVIWDHQTDGERRRTDQFDWTPVDDLLVPQYDV